MRLGQISKAANRLTALLVYYILSIFVNTFFGKLFEKINQFFFRIKKALLIDFIIWNLLHGCSFT